MATTSIGAPGVTFPDATVQATAGATGVPVLIVNTSTGSYTKPASVKAIKVTVIAGGGNGGPAVLSIGAGWIGAAGGGGGGGGTSIRIYPAPSLPASAVPFTVGAAASSSSFGVAPLTVITATAGSVGGTGSDGPVIRTVDSYVAAGGAGGAGSGGTQNSNGNAGVAGISVFSGPASTSTAVSGAGGGSSLGGGATPVSSRLTLQNITGPSGNAYGGGGAGSLRTTTQISPTGTTPGGAGAAGVVIIEEFY